MWHAAIFGGDTESACKLCLPAAGFELKSSSLMLLAATRTENRHVMIRAPADAFKLPNYRTFSPIEIVDVNAAAALLCDAMPVITRSRKTARPSLCAAMADWMSRFVMDRADILNVERTSWRRHEEFYTQHMLGICLRMSWVRETWVRRTFRRLCGQFCVVTAVELARILSTCMERNESIVYVAESS